MRTSSFILDFGSLICFIFLIVSFYSVCIPTRSFFRVIYNAKYYRNKIKRRCRKNGVGKGKGRKMHQNGVKCPKTPFSGYPIRCRIYVLCMNVFFFLIILSLCSLPVEFILSFLTLFYFLEAFWPALCIAGQPKVLHFMHIFSFWILNACTYISIHRFSLIFWIFLLSVSK